MHLIVGLGNPGPKYAANRHNLGFMVVDCIASRHGMPAWKDKWRAQYTKVSLGTHDAILLKPQTYMNLSGESVQAALTFFQIEISQVVCIHDELDLEFNTLRIKNGGGTAGHNGLKSIVQHCGSDFVRVRMGIGRPHKGQTESWVLSNFSKEEVLFLDDFMSQGAYSVETIISEGAASAMNRFNQREK